MDQQKDVTLTEANSPIRRSTKPETSIDESPAARSEDGRHSRPLVINLDGTLVSTDLLVEGFFALLYRSPWQAAVTLLALASGKAAFKAAVARRQPIDVSTLPYRRSVLRLAEKARASGREVVLATAADRSYANSVASFLGLFGHVIASDGVVNVSGTEKAALLKEQYPRGFDYIGDATGDMKVWSLAANTLVVAPTSRVLAAARRNRIDLQIIPDEERSPLWRELIRLARPSQWSKNLLIFAPAILGHAVTNAGVLASSALALVSFSLCASATYVLNDLSDVAADRRHPRKSRRPLAAGRVDPLLAGGFAFMLLATGLALALINSIGLAAGIAGYLILTTVYSSVLKPIVLADVILLGFFYVYRVLLGGVATGIPVSHWLLVFCGFFFFSLALVKRHSELILQGDAASSDGRRGYMPADLPVIGSLGISSSMASILTLALYIRGETALQIYGAPDLLWLWIPLMLYWTSRVWMLSARGALVDDPILFAVKDRVSYGVATGMLATFVAATILVIH